MKKKTKQSKIQLSHAAEQARDIIQDHYERVITQKAVKSRYEQMLTSQGFVSGLCAMAQLNQMRLTSKDAADVFRTLKPIFDKFSGKTE